MRKPPTRPGPAAYITATTLGLIGISLISLRIATYLAEVALGRDLNLTTCVGGAALIAASILTFDRLRIRRQRDRADAAEQSRQVAEERAAKATAEADQLRRHRDLFEQRRQAEERAARQAEERSWWADDTDSEGDTLEWGNGVIPLILRRQDKESA